MVNRNFWLKLKGQVIENKYHLKELLGVGGCGAVFSVDEVVRDRLIRMVAIKLIIAADDSLKQLDELISATTLKHSHLLDCYTCGECTLNGMDFLYLLMEKASSTLLLSIEKGKLSPSATKELVAQIAPAIDFLHSQAKPIVHRDLKPANILKVGDKWKISDFGLVKTLGNKSIDITSTLMGTPGYTPPEGYQGEYSTAWDVWSMGVIIFECLTGERPFLGDTPQQLLLQVLNHQPDLTNLPSFWQEIVKSCLSKDRKNRPSAKQVLNSISAPTPSYVNIPAPAAPTKTPIVPTSPSPVINEPLTLDLGGGVTLELVKIPAGSFLMGGEHQIILTRFFMGKYPVTQRQYQQIMVNNPSYFQGDKLQPSSSFLSGLFGNNRGDNHPVEYVSWHDAVKFCEKVSSKTGRQVTLPSETQWEYAARAGSKEIYFFGNIYDQLGDYAWYTKNSGNKTHPVGEKKPNPMGLYDILGNVWEWCADDWDVNYKKLPGDGKSLKYNNTIRSRRGGSWINEPDNCRCDYRDWLEADHRYRSIGFRVLVVPRTFYPYVLYTS